MKSADVKKYFYDIVKEVFDGGFVGIFDNKLYLNLNIDGETVQVAVSATMVKDPVGKAVVEEKPVPDFPFTLDENKEEDTIAELMKRLGF